MTTRTRLGLGLVLTASLGGGAFFFSTAIAQRADTSPASLAPGRVPGQTVTLLPDGRWLLLGGESPTGLIGSGSIVDPRTGATTPIPNGLSVPRADHTATVLPDGSVLIVGGRSADGVASIPEVFDPATQAFTIVPIGGSTPRSGHTATLLTDGRVLVTGGSSGGLEPPATEVWDLQAHTAASVPARIARQGHTATLLGDGRVLIEGGRQFVAILVQLLALAFQLRVVVAQSLRVLTESFRFSARLLDLAAQALQFTLRVIVRARGRALRHATVMADSRKKYKPKLWIRVVNPLTSYVFSNAINLSVGLDSIESESLLTRSILAGAHSPYSPQERDELLQKLGVELPNR